MPHIDGGALSVESDFLRGSGNEEFHSRGEEEEQVEGEKEGVLANESIRFWTKYSYVSVYI